MANKIKVGSHVQCIDSDRLTENIGMKIGNVYEVEAIFVLRGADPKDQVLLFVKGSLGGWESSRFMLYNGKKPCQQDSDEARDCRGGHRHMLRTLAAKALQEGMTQASCTQVQETDEVVSDLPKTLH